MGYVRVPGHLQLIIKHHPQILLGRDRLKENTIDSHCLTLFNDSLGQNHITLDFAIFIFIQLSLIMKKGTANLQSNTGEPHYNAYASACSYRSKLYHQHYCNSFP